MVWHGLSSTTSKRTNKELSRSLPVLSNEVFVLVFLILKKGEGQRICFFSWIGCPSRRKLVLHASPFPLKYDPPASRYDTFPRTTQSPCSIIHLLWRTTHFPVRPSFLEACSICLEARHISISAIQLTDNHLQSEQRLPLLCPRWLSFFLSDCGCLDKMNEKRDHGILLVYPMSSIPMFLL